MRTFVVGVSVQVTLVLSPPAASSPEAFHQWNSGEQRRPEQARQSGPLRS
jgi:hypothetical protein